MGPTVNGDAIQKRKIIEIKAMFIPGEIFVALFEQPVFQLIPNDVVTLGIYVLIYEYIKYLVLLSFLVALL